MKRGCLDAALSRKPADRKQQLRAFVGEGGREIMGGREGRFSCLAVASFFNEFFGKNMHSQWLEGIDAKIIMKLSGEKQTSSPIKPISSPPAALIGLLSGIVTRHGLPPFFVTWYSSVRPFHAPL